MAKKTDRATENNEEILYLGSSKHHKKYNKPLKANIKKQAI